MGPKLNQQICCLHIKSCLYSKTSIKQVMYLWWKRFELVEENHPGRPLHNLVCILHLTEYSRDHLWLFSRQFHLMRYGREGAMSEEAVTETQFSLKTVALRVFHLPLSWYYSLNQVINTLSKYCYFCYTIRSLLQRCTCSCECELNLYRIPWGLVCL